MTQLVRKEDWGLAAFSALAAIGLVVYMHGYTFAGTAEFTAAQGLAIGFCGMLLHLIGNARSIEYTGLVTNPHGGKMFARKRKTANATYYGMALIAWGVVQFINSGVLGP